MRVCVCVFVSSNLYVGVTGCQVQSQCHATKAVLSSLGNGDTMSAPTIGM